ncbi:MAG: TIGR01777 family oxidoreductase [Actinomycetota bacterium]|nr:TIGR01777 family oxidoreductase [Actinomycetota bacterium]
MEVIVTGASGLIGQALLARLEARGDRVRRMVRRPVIDQSEIRWDPDKGHLDPAALVGADAVVHLAGTGIAERRWTRSQKDRILESRTRGTRLLAQSLSEVFPVGGPRVLVSGSAIGFYGDRGDEPLTESSEPGTGFLAEVCVAWESATQDAGLAGLRVTQARTGVVLSAAGGLLARLLPLFRIGLGGQVGSGDQIISWISLADQVAALIWLIDTDVSGPVNLVAPSPVTNSEFSRTLGRVLGRPSRLRIPSAGPMLLYGRYLTRELILASTLALPGVLVDSGFVFSHSSIESALSANI